MWIRSQDGKFLVEVKFIGAVGFNVYGEYEGLQRDITLGQYESEEKAIGVLTQIQAHINDYEYAAITGQESVAKVFLMP